ncbi:MAG: ester cyclase [Candidatus Rokuibacteriota bacterium]
MTRDEINELIGRLLEAFVRRDIEALTQLHAEDGVVESPLAGGLARRRDAIARVYQSLFQAFPDVKLQADEPLIDGNRAVLVTRLSGTDRGGLLGTAPTGRTFDVPCLLLFDFENGLIARERRIYDFTGVALQVGAIKAKPL